MPTIDCLQDFNKPLNRPQSKRAKIKTKKSFETNREVKMLDHSIKFTRTWTVAPESPFPAYVPHSYLPLLSLMDNGWKIRAAELVPSWDQHGFVYLVTVHLDGRDSTQKLVLPKNRLLDELLTESLAETPSPDGDRHSVVV
jgi:hypothetical protein